MVDGQVDGSFKSPMGGLLNSIDNRTLSQTTGQSPTSIAISNTQPSNPVDTMTSVYSIVMDDTSADDSGLEPLGDHQISAEQEVELGDSLGDKAAHQIPDQIQISTSSSPLSIAHASSGVMHGGGGTGLVAKRSLLHNQSVKVSPSSRSVSINSHSYKGAMGTETSADDQVGDLCISSACFWGACEGCLFVVVVVFEFRLCLCT